MPPTPDAYLYRWHACIAGKLTCVDRPKSGMRTRLGAREVHARMHARWPTRFRSDHACSMRVASASAARCTACGCIGRTQVFRREQAEHFGRCKHLPLRCARHLTPSRCYGLQPAALRTAGSMLMQCSRCCRLDWPPTFAAVQAHRSTVSQPVHSWSIQGCHWQWLTNKRRNRLGETVLDRLMRFHANLILLDSLEAVYFADGELVVCPRDLEFPGGRRLGAAFR
jgi:hypothetical protein